MELNFLNKKESKGKITNYKISIMKKLTSTKSGIKYFVLLILMSSVLTSYSQCDVQATASHDTICAGDSISLSATGNCGYLMKNDFNNGTVGIGWSYTGANPVMTNPCGPGPNGMHVWIGATATIQRTMTTSNYNITNGNCVINWLMRYGRDQNIGNCNAPDAMYEGVHLQYSVNNGGSYHDFPGPNVLPTGPNCTTPPFITTIPGSGGYWQPVSDSIAQSNHAAYFWHRYSCVIPSIAICANTKFRWAQLANSNAGHDAWGIDEVEIICSTSSLNVLWSTGDTVFNPATIYLPPHPNNLPYDTCFIVTISDSTYSASDTVCVHVNPIPTVNLGIDTILKLTHTITLDAGAGFTNYLWNDSTTNQSKQIVGSVAGVGTHNYYVDVTDSNGCQGSDTIVVEVIDDTGINFKNHLSSISLIPNPANAQLNIEFQNIKPDFPVEIELYNSMGALVKVVHFKQNESCVDVSDLPQGFYIVAVQSKGKILVRQKIVISR